MSLCDKSFYDDLLLLNPLTATFIGDYRFEDLYTNVNTKYYRTEMRKLIKKYYIKECKSEFDKIRNYVLNKEKILLNMPLHYMPVTHFSNPYKDILSIIERMQFMVLNDPYDSFTKFKKRIYSMISYIPELKRNILKGISLNYVENKKVISFLIDDLRNIKLEGPDYYISFMNDTFIKSAIDFSNFLEREYLNHCRNELGFCFLPNGISIYKKLLAFNIDYDQITAEEVFELGQIEIQKTEQKILKLNTKNEKEEYFKSEDEVVKEYKKALITLEKDSKDLLKWPKWYKRTNISKINSMYDPAAYYFTGTLNGDIPGSFKINVRSYKELKKSDVKNLVIHEAVPGHSLQLQYTMNNKIPKWLKIQDFTSTIEGWALYSERFIKNPTLLEQYSTLNSYQLRAVRLYVDVGMHLYGFTYEQVYNIMKKYLNNNESEIIAEIYRYCVLPGQATSYMIGCKVFESMRPFFKDDSSFNTFILQNSYKPLCFIVKTKNKFLKQKINF